MSLKPDVIGSSDEAVSTATLSNNAMSGNGWTANPADLDSEWFAEGRRVEGDLIVSRFLAKIHHELIRADLGPCWVWTGATLGSRSVYGSFAGKKNGKPWPRYAHKLAWEWTHGPVVAPLKVCHHCDVMLCVNPRHLFLGTQKDNLDDARAKGRLIDGLHARVLSDDAYRDILATPRTYGSNLALARKYGTSTTTISRIRSGAQGRVFREHGSLTNVEPVKTVDLPVFDWPVRHVPQSAAVIVPVQRNSIVESH